MPIKGTLSRQNYQQKGMPTTLNTTLCERNPSEMGKANTKQITKTGIPKLVLKISTLFSPSLVKIQG